MKHDIYYKEQLISVQIKPRRYVYVCVCVCVCVYRHVCNSFEILFVCIYVYIKHDVVMQNKGWNVMVL